MGFLKRHPAVFLGLGITLLFLLLGLSRVAFIDALEYKFYDLRMKLRGQPETGNEIVMVDIDNDSIEKLGRWPWSRSMLARGIDKIEGGQPRAVGLNIILSEPEESAGLIEIDRLEDIFLDRLMPASGDNGYTFLQALEESRERLDNDRRLEKSLAASGRVILPVFLVESAVVAESGPEPDAALAAQSLKQVTDLDLGWCPRADEIVLPIPRFFESAAGIGHINFAPDMEDGTARRERLLYEYRGLYIPSYTLRLAAAYLNVDPAGIEVQLGAAVHLGALSIPTTSFAELMVNFKGPRGSFKSFSYVDVIHDKIPPSVFKNKLVLVSASAPGIMNPISTSVDPSMPVGEFSANAIWSMLNRRFVLQPVWGASLEMLLILVLGLLVAFVLPRLGAGVAGSTFVLLLAVLVGGATYAFVARGLWMPVAYPLLELVLGYIGVVSIRFFVTETGKKKVEGESAESNRMLGVSFQEQGMLDMAFEKFRRVPVDDQLKDVLYNLGLDYERKRQLNKAAAVYEYIEEHDPKFKDVGQRKSKLMQASETMVYGDSFLGAQSSTDEMVATGTDVRPTLGRYEVIKPLGKGAMGIVYLGKDPRINRTTAIKTVRFSDDFGPEEAEEMKIRFFREAESAGTLSHPHIVTIYDAGEEQDLAYIAMEFLEGEDLERYIKKDQLLPMRKVITYMADVADALDYAHQKGIVHRDIKPANIMLIKSGVVKITDFGIARITASSQTQTGVVKGTPYYMSPEQIAGKKVDGRSDIFSVGTMMYQLLTGRVPFSGDSPAALMHQILNVRHRDPRKHNSKIYKPLVTIIDKTLEKDVNQRYKRASLLAGHLRQLGQRIDALKAQKTGSGETGG